VNINYKIMPFMIVMLIAAISIILKLHVFTVGAPYVTIDDNTLYEAGFLVWFGEAPPQRMYFESWLAGVTSIFTYLCKLISAGNLDLVSINLVADAYRDFLNHPEQYIYSYRALMLTVDISTAIIIFFFARHIFSTLKNADWLAALSAGLFLLSYNTAWCFLVARPDTITTFFVVLGTFFYFKSNFGENKNYFYGSAIALGIATGFKLHAALFVTFFILDMIRQLGFIVAIKRSIPFGLISVFIFSVAAGTLLFDPLLYIKLRALNIRDDESPWLQWGDQFITALKGTGYIIAPAIIFGIPFYWAKNKSTIPAHIKSILFVAFALLVFFLSIRQLRAYWMLPALPIFYVAAIYLLSTLKNKLITYLLITVTGLMFFYQIYQQSREFDNARYSELSTWVQKNIAEKDAIYIIGYETLFLPCNTTCLKNRKTSLEFLIDQALHSGENYTARHVRLWEERARLEFINMLEVKSDSGFNYYSLNSTPLESLKGAIEFKDIKYVLAMQDYRSTEADKLLLRVQQEFTKVATLMAPGGKAGTKGLPYDIYVRKQHDFTE